MGSLTAWNGNNDGSELGTVKLWIERGTVESGIVTIYPTDDHTAEGNARFSEILGVFALARKNVSAGVNMPVVSLKSVSEDLKTIVANVAKGVTLSILGATLQAAENGLEVDIVILGY